MRKSGVSRLASQTAETSEGLGAHVAGAPESMRATKRSPKSSSDAALRGAVTGVLIGFRDQGRTPLVIFPGQTGTAAVAARTTQDLHAAHIGRQVVLLFESADCRFPIIVGSIKRPDAGSIPDGIGHVEIDADGERLIVSAKEQLVLQCGKASVTLTKAGKVLIHGTYVSTHSSGANRIKGGSVQIN